MSSILVGLDLSPSSRAALQWAAQQARLTGRRLLPINAVPIPPGPRLYRHHWHARVGHGGLSRDMLQGVKRRAEQVRRTGAPE